VLAALLSGSRLLSVVHAAETPDEGLLEFLGSVDTEDPAWHDYLARTDIDKVARRPPSPSNNPVPAKAPPPVDPPPPAAKPAQPGTPP
jgi:hypothetical protein